MEVFPEPVVVAAGSTIVTSDLPFEEWTTVFGSQRLTGALLDRLTHHVHILELNGDATGSSNQRRVGMRPKPPMRKPQPSIPKPAKSPPLPESLVRPGYETPAISAEADVALPNLRLAGNWPALPGRLLLRR